MVSVRCKGEDGIVVVMLFFFFFKEEKGYEVFGCFVGLGKVKREKFLLG